MHRSKCVVWTLTQALWLQSVCGEGMSLTDGGRLQGCFRACESLSFREVPQMFHQVGRVDEVL